MVYFGKRGGWWDHFSANGYKESAYPWADGTRRNEGQRSAQTQAKRYWWSKTYSYRSKKRQRGWNGLHSAKLADRLKEYIRIEKIGLDDRIFPLCYASVRIIVKKAGKLIGLNLKTHDLRRHSATFASRSGIPIEIISKIILRHSNLSTTQRYLGKVTDIEAIRWIENLYG